MLGRMDEILGGGRLVLGPFPARRSGIDGLYCQGLPTVGLGRERGGRDPGL